MSRLLVRTTVNNSGQQQLLFIVTTTTVEAVQHYVQYHKSARPFDRWSCQRPDMQNIPTAALTVLYSRGIDTLLRCLRRSQLRLPGWRGASVPSPTNLPPRRSHSSRFPPIEQRPTRANHIPSATRRWLRRMHVAARHDCVDASAASHRLPDDRPASSQPQHSRSEAAQSAPAPHHPRNKVQQGLEVLLSHKVATRKHSPKHQTTSATSAAKRRGGKLPPAVPTTQLNARQCRRHS